MGNHGPAQKRREKSEIQVSTGIRRLANFRLWAPVISANCVVGQKKNIRGSDLTHGVRRVLSNYR